MDNKIIDLVYLWVDDTDYYWKEKKKKYENVKYNYDKDAVDTCRFYNNDELKYSLRSVAKNLPWIHKIFIVTDNQVPEWLNLENPKIKIVNHNEIIPKEKLPLFNSCAIESRIPFINDLSEYFIYANDDCFIWKPVDKDFFFLDDKPICRMDKKLNYKKAYNHLYGHTVFNMYKLIEKKFFTWFPPYFPHHNIDAYRKSLFLECINEYKKEFNQTLDNRFRNYSDVQRIIVSYYSLAKNQAVIKNKQSFLNRILKKEQDSCTISLKKSTIARIKKVNSKLLCLNDNRKTTNKEREKVHTLLEEIFPQKSEFEL